MRSSDFFATHPVFTHGEYLAACQKRGKRSSRTADSLLARYLAAGRILHVRRGLYASIPVGANPKTFQVSPYLIATKLAPDAVVAYHAALQFRGRTYSIWHRFSVLSQRHLRRLVFQGNEFIPIKPPRALLPGIGGGITEEVYAIVHEGKSPADAVTPRSPFVMSLDAPRLREDAAVIHMAWQTQGARLIPSVDADLELAARGPTRSDLQLLGTYRYDEHAPATAAERSLSHRATVSAVRHLLEALAEATTGDAHIGSTPFGGA